MKLGIPARNLLPGTLLACALLFAACGAEDTEDTVVETEDTVVETEDSTVVETEDTVVETEDSTVETEEGAAETEEGAEVANGVTRLWIMPDLADCVGVAPQTCMQVAEAADGPYELFYDGIAGFTFTEGTSYVLDVMITEVADPPADGSSLAYTLVEIIEES